MSKERLREILNNLIGWAGEHSDEFYECFVGAMDVTEEEADELKLFNE